MSGQSFNKSPYRVSRRKVVGGIAGGIAATSLLPGILQARSAPAMIQSGGKLTYWGGLIFSDDANQMLTDTINDWGKANGVETDVVMINQNETNQKVSAAVESGTMPDALDMGLDLLLLLSSTGQLAALDELYDKIGAAHGGWYESIDSSLAPEKFGGSRYGVPFGASGNMLFGRKDILEEAGITEMPKTWQELSDAAEKAQQPNVFGMGFALSNVGDGNLNMSILQSYGGRIADDEGKNCTIKSPETKSYLEWLKAAWDAGLFPPGATTWDGAGDNTAYLSGQAIFIANTGSVSIKAQEDDPDLYEATQYAALPAGPVMQVSPVNPNVRAIPTTTKDPATAQALIEHLSQPEFLQEYYKVAIYGPVLKDQADFEAFGDAVHSGLKDLVLHGTAPGAPDVNNTAYADFSANFIVPKMLQRIVVDGLSIDDALDEAQEQGDAIYAKHR
ncbi:MAG TPA: extracellular solute-binding protein [Thermomicrobiales bacterium]|nr:extracellular solute-binding protein [Thermomicrobiales bacterium]